MLTIDYALFESYTAPFSSIRQRVFVNRKEELCLRYHLLPFQYQKRKTEWIAKKLKAHWQDCLSTQRRAGSGQGYSFSDLRRSTEGFGLRAEWGGLWLEQELAIRLGLQQPELTEEVILWSVGRTLVHPAAGTPGRHCAAAYPSGGPAARLSALICLDEPATDQRRRFGGEKLSRVVWQLHSGLNHLLIVTGLPELYGEVLRQIYEDSGLVGSCTPAFSGLPAGWSGKETMVLDLAGNGKREGNYLDPRNFLDTYAKNEYNTLIVSRAGKAEKERPDACG